VLLVDRQLGVYWCWLWTSGGCTSWLFISREHTLNWVPAAARWWAVAERCAVCTSEASATQRGEPDSCTSTVANHHRSHSGDSTVVSLISVVLWIFFFWFLRLSHNTGAKATRQWVHLWFTLLATQFLARVQHSLLNCVLFSSYY